MSELEIAIKQLYSAFTKVKKPKRVEGCECCMDPKSLDALLSTNIQNVPDELISQYASLALLTVGSVEDYLYFVPRILHRHAEDESFYPDPETTGRAIAKTNVHDWPAVRKQALEKYFNAVIHSVLEQQRYDQLDGWMCAIANTGLSVLSYIDEIDQNRDAVLAYFNDNVSTLPEKKLSNAFWELPNKGHDEIVDWMVSPRSRELLFSEYGFEFPK